MSAHHPAALECLALLVPTAEELDLLRACLWSGQPAREAWVRWLRSVGDPRAAIEQDVSGVKSLLALLHRAATSGRPYDRGLARAGGDPAAGPRHVLAAAYVTDQLRWKAYAEVSTRAFEALAAAAIPFLVLKGAALSVSVYPEPAVRHSHDVDLLVAGPDLEPAAQALRAAGFARPQPARRPGAESIRLVDACGLPIELHTRLYRLPYYTTPPGVWDRAQRCEIGGVRVRTLSTADHLVYVCGRASCCASRDSLKWAADAWLLARNGDPDWAVALRAVDESRLALPLAVLLRALAVHLEAPVPPAVLERLSAAAAAADRSARHVAIAGVRAGRRGRVRELFRATSTWRGRAGLAGWMLFPSPTGLRLGEPLHYPRAWPAYYLTRPVTSAARHLAAALRRSVA